MPFPTLFPSLLLTIFAALSMETPHIKNAEVDRSACSDEFDAGLRRQCMRGEWEEKYYFESGSQTCRLFWYDGCPSAVGSRNFFDSLLECQWLCEPSQFAAICLEDFDEHLRDECGQSDGERRFYFDRQKQRCVPFWFANCESDGRNHFETEQSCVRQCEMPAIESTQKSMQSAVPTPSVNSLPFLRSPAEIAENKGGNDGFGRGQLTTPTTIGHTERHSERQLQRPNEYFTAVNRPSATRPPSDAFPRMPVTPRRPVMAPAGIITTTSRSPPPVMPTMPSSRNLCVPNPCLNNGTCVQNAGEFYCRCASGFTNDDCSERVDFDPCSSDGPCQNGGTCAAKAGPEKTEFDCFCLRGFAGRHCELKPCEKNPCKNNGICRTTRSPSMFFCACAPGWGGKTCAIAIPASAEDLNGPLEGNFTKQLSSGRIEWIENMRNSTLAAISHRLPSTTARNVSDNFELVVSSAEDGALVLRRSSKDYGNQSEELIIGELPSISLRTSTKSPSNGCNGMENKSFHQCRFAIILILFLLCRNFVPFQM